MNLEKCPKCGTLMCACMADDIVKRLHGEHYCDQCEDDFLPNDEGSGVLSPGLHSLAALEIERLRAALKAVRGLLAERTAERDSWQSAREDLAEANKRLCAALRAQQLMQQGLGTLDVDNERMRAALQRIVAQDDIALAEEGYREGFASVVRIARKALRPDWTTFYTRSGVEVCPQCTTPTTCKTLGCLPPPQCDI